MIGFITCIRHVTLVGVTIIRSIRVTYNLRICTVYDCKINVFVNNLCGEGVNTDIRQSCLFNGHCTEETSGYISMIGII